MGYTWAVPSDTYARGGGAVAGSTWAAIDVELGGACPGVRAVRVAAGMMKSADA
jgi:hypothetical protein